LLEKQDFLRSQERTNKIKYIHNMIEKSNKMNNLTLIKQSIKLNEILDKKLEKDKKDMDEKYKIIFDSINL